jgi:hypothetical protein
VENRVGDGRRVPQIETTAGDNFVRDEDHVAQDCEEVFLYSADHLAVYEGGRGGVVHFELYAPGLAEDGYIEVFVAVEDLFGVVGVGAAVQDREGAFTKERVETALAGIQELAYLVLGEVFEGTAGAYSGVYKFRN